MTSSWTNRASVAQRQSLWLGIESARVRNALGLTGFSVRQKILSALLCAAQSLVALVAEFWIISQSFFLSHMGAAVLTSSPVNSIDFIALFSLLSLLSFKNFQNSKKWDDSILDAPKSLMAKHWDTTGFSIEFIKLADFELVRYLDAKICHFYDSQLFE